MPSHPRPPILAPYLDCYVGQGRIQDSEGGGVRTFRRGGGGSYRNFRSGSKLLQGPGQTNKQKKIADSRRGGGGGPITQKNPLYPRMWGIRLSHSIDTSTGTVRFLDNPRPPPAKYGRPASAAAGFGRARQTPTCGYHDTHLSKASSV